MTHVSTALKGSSAKINIYRSKAKKNSEKRLLIIEPDRFI